MLDETQFPTGKKQSKERSTGFNEARVSALLELSNMTRASLQEIAGFAMEQGVLLTGSKIGYVAFVSEDEKTLTMHSWSREAMDQCCIESKPLVYPVETTGLWGEAIRQRKPIITNDYAAPNSLKKGCPKGHISLLRHMNVPVFDDDRIVVVAGVGNKDGDYDDSDVRQLTLLMRGMWQIVKQHRVEEDLRRLNAELEERVKERTNQLENAVKDLVQRAAELEAVNSELEAFSYSVSHDLRAPLRSIDGFSNALLEDYSSILDETGQDYLQRVRSATQRMNLLINDILRLSRITRVQMHREEVNLTVIAQEIAEDLKTSQPERNTEFAIQQGIVADGDPFTLRIILENLLENAWKFTSKQTCGRIKVESAQCNGETVYSVSDNGAGFNMTYANKLFQPFQRLHTEDDFPGTGVGLAIVKRVVQRHGGRVWAQGQVECGATFYFTLGEEHSTV